MISKLTIALVVAVLLSCSTACLAQSTETFTIQEVKLVPKVGIVMKAVDSRQKPCKPRVCTRDEIEEFKWYFGAEDASELAKRQFSGTSFENAFASIVKYREAMNADQKLANVLASRIKNKTSQELPEGYAFTEKDFVDKSSLRSDLLSLVNERLDKITNGKAILESVDRKEITALPNLPCFAAYKYTVKDNPKLNFNLLIVPDPPNPIIFK